jgi:hypothetical protein
MLQTDLSAREVKSQSMVGTPAGTVRRLPLECASRSHLPRGLALRRKVESPPLCNISIRIYALVLDSR